MELCTFFLIFLTDPLPLVGVSKKQDCASLRTPFVSFLFEKERSIKLALSFSGTVVMGLAMQHIEENLASQVRIYVARQGVSRRMPRARAGVGEWIPQQMDKAHKGESHPKAAWGKLKANLDLKH